CRRAAALRPSAGEYGCRTAGFHQAFLRAADVIGDAGVAEAIDDRGVQELGRRREGVIVEELDGFALLFFRDAAKGLGAAAAEGSAFDDAAEVEGDSPEPPGAMPQGGFVGLLQQREIF